MPMTDRKLIGNRCKCAVCGEVFSTERNFELHRYGDYSEGRTCLLPQTVNLRRVQTNTGSVWKSNKTMDEGLKDALQSM